MCRMSCPLRSRSLHTSLLSAPRAGVVDPQKQRIPLGCSSASARAAQPGTPVGDTQHLKRAPLSTQPKPSRVLPASLFSSGAVTHAPLTVSAASGTAINGGLWRPDCTLSFHMQVDNLSARLGGPSWARSPITFEYECSRAHTITRQVGCCDERGAQFLQDVARCT